MDYTKYIQRKIGNLVLKRNNESFKSRYSYTYNGLNNNKEKEIIVYLRNQKDMDKQQLMDFAKETFNVSERDAERIFFIAYPDGLDLKEERMIKDLNKNFEEMDYMPKKLIDTVFDSLLEHKKVPSIGINPAVMNMTTVVIESLLNNRNLL